MVTIRCGPTMSLSCSECSWAWTYPAPRMTHTGLRVAVLHATHHKQADTEGVN